MSIKRKIFITLLQYPPRIQRSRYIDFILERVSINIFSFFESHLIKLDIIYYLFIYYYKYI